GPLAVGHNGNLVNTPYLAERVRERGVTLESTTDSEVIAQLCATAPGRDWIERLRNTMPMLKGAFSLVMLTRDQLIAVRDPYGIRPLCFGRLGSSWVVASETCALNTIGAEVLRELLPGEIMVVDKSGCHSYELDRGDARRALCVFEYIYFARPDSTID